MPKQKGTAVALRQSEEFVRLLLNSTGVGIYGVDLEGNCTFCNPACVRILGYRSSDELLGKFMHDLVHHSTPDGKAYPPEECRSTERFVNRKVFMRIMSFYGAGTEPVFRPSIGPIQCSEMVK
jgi:PAS domain-containing protein